MDNPEKEPPKMLVKTWIEMIRNSDDSNVRERASEMLLGTFEDMKSAAEFAAKHKLY